MLDRLAYWYSRAWCAIDGHQWMPTGAGGYVCIRKACRGGACRG